MTGPTQGPNTNNPFAQFAQSLAKGVGTNPTGNPQTTTSRSVSGPLRDDPAKLVIGSGRTDKDITDPKISRTPVGVTDAQRAELIKAINPSAARDVDTHLEQVPGEARVSSEEAVKSGLINNLKSTLYSKVFAPWEWHPLIQGAIKYATLTVGDVHLTAEQKTKLKVPKKIEDFSSWFGAFMSWTSEKFSPMTAVTFSLMVFYDLVSPALQWFTSNLFYPMSDLPVLNRFLISFEENQEAARQAMTFNIPLVEYSKYLGQAGLSKGVELVNALTNLGLNAVAMPEMTEALSSAQREFWLHMLLSYMATLTILGFQNGFKTGEGKDSIWMLPIRMMDYLIDVSTVPLSFDPLTILKTVLPFNIEKISTDNQLGDLLAQYNISEKKSPWAKVKDLILRKQKEWAEYKSPGFLTTASAFHYALQSEALLIEKNFLGTIRSYETEQNIFQGFKMDPRFEIAKELSLFQKIAHDLSVSFNLTRKYLSTKLVIGGIAVENQLMDEDFRTYLPFHHGAKFYLKSVNTRFNILNRFSHAMADVLPETTGEAQSFLYDVFAINVLIHVAFMAVSQLDMLLADYATVMKDLGISITLVTIFSCLCNTIISKYVGKYSPSLAGGWRQVVGSIQVGLIAGVVSPAFQPEFQYALKFALGFALLFGFSTVIKDMIMKSINPDEVEDDSHGKGYEHMIEQMKQNALGYVSKIRNGDIRMSRNSDALEQSGKKVLDQRALEQEATVLFDRVKESLSDVLSDATLVTGVESGDPDAIEALQEKIAAAMSSNDPMDPA